MELYFECMNSTIRYLSLNAASEEDKITLEIINDRMMNWSFYDAFNSKNMAISEISKMIEFIKFIDAEDWWNYIHIDDLKAAAKYIAFS